MQDEEEIAAYLARVAPDWEGWDDDGDLEPLPPPARRVAQRALVLSSMSARALTEDDPATQDIEGFRAELWDWLRASGLEGELEPFERRMLSSPDAFEGQAATNAVWTVEALGMLAWSLGWAELPRYDELVTPNELWNAARLFAPVADVRSLLNSATLRPPAELDAMATHQLALHWRLRDMSLQWRSMDFVAFSDDCWFGSFPLTGFDIVDRDLAIGGVAIRDVSRDVFSRTMSTVMERDRAIRWLGGDQPVFSKVDTST